MLRIGPEVPPEQAHGEFIGLAAFSAAGARLLRDGYHHLRSERAEGLDKASVTHLLQAMIDRGRTVTAIDVHKGWMDIDSFEDYRRAWAEIRR